MSENKDLRYFVLLTTGREADAEMYLEELRTDGMDEKSILVLQFQVACLLGLTKQRIAYSKRLMSEYQFTISDLQQLFQEAKTFGA
jgi:Tfp pilus assembly protein PilF